MPIDIAKEELITFAQAAAHLPRRRRGRKAAVSTMHRWATRGLHGVMLEYVQAGGTKCTSMAAIQRFFEGLAAANHPASALTTDSQEQHSRAERAGAELDRIWAGGKPPRSTRTRTKDARQ